MDDRRLNRGVAPPPQRPAVPRLARAILPWLLFVAALTFGGWAALQLWRPAAPGDPLATTLVAFAKQDRLTVFSAQLAPVVASDDARLFGMLKSRQVAVIPARVDYGLDLGAMTRDRMAWDAAAHRLTVTLPPLTLSRPDLDEGRAQYLREGVWITQTAQEKLTRANTQLAEQQAAVAAASPALMTLARNAAKDAIRQNLAIPLEVAGFGKVQVDARFEGEP